MLSAYLAENAFKVPSDAMLYKILSNCPAAEMKEAQGIDPIVDDAMNSFKEMQELIKKLGSYGVDKEICTNLTNALNVQKIYLKSHYFYNLQVHI